MSTSMLQPPCEIPLAEGEVWWGGRASDGVEMPFGAGRAHRVELHTDHRANQAVPFLVSSRGRFIWSEHPFAFTFEGAVLSLRGSVHPVLLSEGHGSLAGAFRAAARQHFPASGVVPPAEFFSSPQYNTWIELNHRQTQEDVLRYARDLIRNGYPPGILVIDAGWSEYFGHLDFHPGRFPDPRAMVRELREAGFRVLLWVSPFWSADSAEYRRWRALPGWLLRRRDGTPAVLEWWDGHSVHLDVTHPEAVAWFHEQLARLQRDYGVDGFKFDAGDPVYYKDRPASWLEASPAELCEAWAKIGLRYRFNEFRACWKMAGQPLVQRLHDTAPSWDQGGLGALIPNGVALGLLGHPFLCPDMVGGGDYLHFLNAGFQGDDELFVRWTQASALFPMIQFSSAPWRVLPEEARKLCLAAVALRRTFTPLILEEAAASAQTGEPVMRALEYQFPGRGYASVRDQFLIGEWLMVAPVVERGARTRRVVIPPGTWRDDRGETVTGPVEREIEAPLDRLPHWTLQAPV